MVVFIISLVLILALFAALTVVTLSDFRRAGLPDLSIPSWDDNDEYPTRTWEGIPPSINQAELGDGTTLSLVSSASREEISFQDNYQKNISSIVGVHVYGADFEGFGTGIIMSSDGYIITNAHVVEGGKQVVVSLYNGAYLSCDLVGFDQYSDLAVLKSYPQDPLTAAEFGDSDELQVGDTALALGNPLGTQLRGTMTNGIISAINRDVKMENGTAMTLIQTTAAINSGNSGGALLNSRGQVVGVTNMKIVANDNTIEGLGFAIPSTTVKQVADSMIATGTYEGTPSIGITGSSAEAGLGVLVHSVNPKSDAYTQGIQAGDIITAVNGHPVFSVDDINALKAGLAVGDTLTLTIAREGGSVTVRVTLVGAYSLN